MNMPRVLCLCATTIGLSLLPLHLSAAERPQALPMQEIVPQLYDEPLVNPGVGIYLFGTMKPADMPSDTWFSNIVNIGYFRTAWSELQPKPGDNGQFDKYFNPIFDLWVKKWGKRVSFRFMSQSMHSKEKYVTPKWVFDEGVPSVLHRGLYTDEQIDPVFWDEKYLAIQERCIAELGKYLDGRPGLEFIDIGSIGEWGEMHLARWTPEQLEKTGFTETKYVAAYRRVIDAFARAFPRTRVFLNVGSYDAINDYAAIRGVHFRQDGLNPKGPSANVGKHLYHPYSRRGIICNYELHSGYDEMKKKQWGIPETFAKGLEDPISYMHINLMSYKRLQNPPAEVRLAVTDAAKKIGFRFVLARLRCNETIRVDGKAPSRLLIEHIWKNIGVAPCYDSYALRWTLVDEQGREIATHLTYLSQPTTRWWPDEDVTLRTMIAVPKDASPGHYRLNVAMVKPEEPALRIQLGITGRKSDGSYELGQIKAETIERPSGVVYEEGFEKGPANWHASKGMTAKVDSDTHGGKGSLLVEGTQSGSAWGYASVDLAKSIFPCSRYRLSCWMKIDRLDPVKPAPYLKIGLTNAKKQHLANVSTNPYDTTKLGTWQQLWANVETTADTAGGHLSIEKGGFELRPTATIRLDDVKLDLVESP